MRIKFILLATNETNVNLYSYLIVILSNQAGLGARNDPKQAKMNTERLNEFKRKVNAVLSQLELPISIYAATGLDKYRKPRIGMWEEVLRNFGLDARNPAIVDMENSFFVGDAGGRAVPTKGKGRKDHSCVDRYVKGLICFIVLFCLLG